jgi:hypothetical protein
MLVNPFYGQSQFLCAGEGIQTGVVLICLIEVLKAVDRASVLAREARKDIPESYVGVLKVTETPNTLGKDQKQKCRHEQEDKPQQDWVWGSSCEPRYVGKELVRSRVVGLAIQN